MMNKILLWTFFGCAAVLFFVIFFHTSYELNADLGTHLLLGRIMWQTHQVPDTNLFSYTFPDHLFLNVHLIQMAYFLLVEYAGFSSLVWVNALLMGIVLLMVTYGGYKWSGSLPATAAAFAIFAPTLLERTEVRPEAFSYLFIAIFIVVLSTYIMTKKSKWLWVLPVLQVLWVNSHIYFVLGIVLVGVTYAAVVISQLIKSKKSNNNYHLVFKEAKPLLFAGLIVVAVTFINPFGLRGLTYPLEAVNGSGFPVIENMNIFQFEKQTFDPTILYFKIAITCFLLSFVVRKYKWSDTEIWSLCMLPLVFLPVLFTRTLPFLFLIQFIFFCDNLAHIKFDVMKKVFTSVLVLGVILLTVIRIGRLVSSQYYKSIDLPARFGASVIEEDKNAVDFVKSLNLSDVIFNDYNIGAYLNYRLYPQNRVFVDARPEAYPTNFGQEYAGILADSNKLAAAMQKYKFTTIIYDHTGSNITFVPNMMKDNTFQLVYLDPRVIVFIKKSQYPELVKKYALTATNFTYKSENYRDNFSLFRVTAMLKWEKQSQMFLDKARNINPDSFQMLWMYGNIYNQTPYMASRGEELLDKYYAKQIVFF